MARVRSLVFCSLVAALLPSAVSFGQQAAPAVRIVGKIDETQLVTLKGNVHPLANPANDRGDAPDNMALSRMELVLKRSPAQETALRQLIQEMSTPGSPNYRKWPTAAATSFPGPAGTFRRPRPA